MNTAIRLIFDTVHYLNVTGKSGILLELDYKAAFDTTWKSPWGARKRIGPQPPIVCRRRRLLMSLFLFFCLISRLLVLSSIFNAFKIIH